MNGSDAAVAFPIRLGRRSRGFLRLWGARPGRSEAIVGHELDIRFGFFRLHTPLANVVGWQIEGPFTWIGAIGVRRSIRHGDVSFAGSPHGGVRVTFRERVRWGIFRVPAVYVGADDLDAFARELARRGIPGRDARRDDR